MKLSLYLGIIISSAILFLIHQRPELFGYPYAGIFFIFFAGWIMFAVIFLGIVIPRMEKDNHL
jgi:hypothetical protein|tara:strand:+ start:2559 stop:2747 length:189 start_codon:yes stop_codon:yes gene_type:complete